MNTLADASPTEGMRMVAVHLYQISQIVEQQKEELSQLRTDMQTQNEVIRYLEQRILEQEKEIKALKNSHPSSRLAYQPTTQVPRSLLANLQTSNDRIDHDAHKKQLDEILNAL